MDTIFVWLLGHVLVVRRAALVVEQAVIGGALAADDPEFLHHHVEVGDDRLDEWIALGLAALGFADCEVPVDVQEQRPGHDIGNVPGAHLPGPVLLHCFLV